MTSKTITTLAFAAGCVLALGAMPPAHAQGLTPNQPSGSRDNPTLTTQPPYAGAYVGQQPGDRGVSMMQERNAAMAPNTGTTMPQNYAGATPEPRPAMGPAPQLETNGPQASRGDYGDWSARRNNIESAHYDRLLQTNMAFRERRKNMECGPINDPQLHQQCLASFQQYEPVMVGSSTPPRRHFRHHRRGSY